MGLVRMSKVWVWGSRDFLGCEGSRGLRLGVSGFRLFLGLSGVAFMSIGVRPRSVTPKP